MCMCVRERKIGRKRKSKRECESYRTHLGKSSFIEKTGAWLVDYMTTYQMHELILARGLILLFNIMQMDNIGGVKGFGVETRG